MVMLLLLLLLCHSRQCLPQDEGSTSANKNKPTEITITICKSKRVAYLHESARRKGVDPALVARVVAMVLRYDL
jgi:hypothetical protein